MEMHPLLRHTLGLRDAHPSPVGRREGLRVRRGRDALFVLQCFQSRQPAAAAGRFPARREPRRRMSAPLILKRASASRPSGEWNDDDFDVLPDGAVVGRIMKTAAAPVGSPWMWTLAFGQHEAS